jgi:hypothetical protein
MQKQGRNQIRDKRIKNRVGIKASAAGNGIFISCPVLIGNSVL